MEPHVEAPEHFHEPLMHERFRNHTRIRFARPLKSKRCRIRQASIVFPRPTSSDQHHARGLTVGDLLCDVKLVRDEINSTAQESAHWRLARAVEQIKRKAPKLKRFRSIKTAANKRSCGPTQTEAVIHSASGSRWFSRDKSANRVVR